jgi:hypothetical protein
MLYNNGKAGEGCRQGRHGRIWNPQVAGGLSPQCSSVVLRGTLKLLAMCAFQSASCWESMGLCGVQHTAWRRVKLYLWCKIAYSQHVTNTNTNTEYRHADTQAPP